MDGNLILNSLLLYLFYKNFKNSISHCKNNYLNFSSHALQLQKGYVFKTSNKK